MGEAVVLVRVSLTLPAPEDAAWVIPGTAARDHVNVVPATGLVGVYANVAPLQIAAGVRVLLRAGIGFTVTTTVRLAAA